MTKDERSALKGFIAQQILFLCEKLGLKTDAETLMKISELLLQKHEQMILSGHSL